MSWLYSLVFAGLLFSSNDQPAVRHAIRNVELRPSAVELVSATRSKSSSRSYPLSKNGNVSVSNVNGSIIVEAWDRDEVRLEATKIADSKETLADVEIKINSTADSFSVRNRLQSLEVERQAEREQPLPEARSRVSPFCPASGCVERDRDGQRIGHGFELHEHHEDLGRERKRHRDESSRYGQPFDRQRSGQRRFRSRRATSKINLSTVNGQVNLVLPSDVSATIKADSLNGNITNDFGLPVRKGQYVGRDMYGRIGSGESQIKLSSVNGGLSITRKNDGRSPSPATNLLTEQEGRRGLGRSRRAKFKSVGPPMSIGKSHGPIANRRADRGVDEGSHRRRSKRCPRSSKM